MKRYIRFAQSLNKQVSAAMQNLIDQCKAEFQSEMAKQDCDTFEEFVYINAFEPKDIKAELRYFVCGIFEGWMPYDGSVVVAEDGTKIPYKQFKQLVVKGL